MALKLNKYVAYLSWMILLAITTAAQGSESSTGAEFVPPSEQASFFTELTEKFEASFRALTWLTVQKASQSSQNPENSFLLLPDTRLTTELRPDFSLNHHALEFSLKPRVLFERTSVVSEFQKNEESELFINEWLIRLQLNEQTFLSYGRENLQWGPSYLLSPSNPFFRENGRLRENKEIRGRDFIRFTWLPTDTWSLSFMANTSTGAAPSVKDFSPIYAFKLDWLGENSYASLIATLDNEVGNQLGAYGGWTVSDAMLLHGEIALQQSSAAYYPVDHAGLQHLEQSKLKDNSLKTVSILGMSYTLETGPTLTLEYLYNEKGYDSTEASLYYDIRQMAANDYMTSGPKSQVASGILARTAAPNLSFLRRHYLMFQYVHSDINDQFSLTGRWLINVQDKSSQLYGNVVYSLDDHLELFSTAVLNSHGDDTEFGSLFKYQLTFGLRYFF